MSLPKALARIEEKLDRLLLLQDAPMPAILPMPDPPAELDPDAVAASLDYDTYTAAEVIARVASLSPAERAALAAYEADNKNRKSVLEALVA